MLRAVLGFLIASVGMAAVSQGQMKPEAELMVASSPPTARRSVIARGLPNAVERMRMQNTARQEKLVSDTNKLLALISNFNQQMNKGDTNLSSAEIAKRAEDIEKLARRIREGMSF